MPEYMGQLLGHDVELYTYSTEIMDDLYIPASVDKGELVPGTRTVTAEGPDLADMTGWSYTVDEDKGLVYIDIGSMEDAVSGGGTASTADAASGHTLTFRCPFIMYKGYSAVNTSTGDEYPVYMGDDGLVRVDVPEGAAGHIEVGYTGTMLQKVTLIISMISVLIYFPVLFTGLKRRT